MIIEVLETSVTELLRFWYRISLRTVLSRNLKDSDQALFHDWHPSKFEG